VLAEAGGPFPLAVACVAGGGSVPPHPNESESATRAMSERERTDVAYLAAAGFLASAAVASYPSG
jgi:hypothetical protein